MLFSWSYSNFLTSAPGIKFVTVEQRLSSRAATKIYINNNTSSNNNTRAQNKNIDFLQAMRIRFDCDV